MTEGRSTGIPTIQNVLENNGSPRATIVTDEDRTFFRITIPCHQSSGNIIADIAEKDKTLKASRRSGFKSALQNEGALQNESALKSALKSALQNAPESTFKIIDQILKKPNATYAEIAAATNYSRRWVAQSIKRLQELGVIERVGADKKGYWRIVIANEP